MDFYISQKPRCQCSSERNCGQSGMLANVILDQAERCRRFYIQWLLLLLRTDQKASTRQTLRTLEFYFHSILHQRTLIAFHLSTEPPNSVLSHRWIFHTSFHTRSTAAVRPCDLLPAAAAGDLTDETTFSTRWITSQAHFHSVTPFVSI